MDKLFVAILIALLCGAAGFHIRGLTKKPRGLQIGMSSDAPAAVKDSSTPLKVKVADNLVGAIFSIRPLFKMASAKARATMIDRASKIGVDWVQYVADLEREQESLSKIYDGLSLKSLVYPDYYLKPFHAYDEGNLSWQAAMEVEPAALTVHAPIFNQDMDQFGDFTLRDNFHKNMLKIFETSGFKPKRIIDIGCSTGLSTLKLHSSFPDSEIIGLDLSPYMLAVGSHNLKTRSEQQSARSSITYLHGVGEKTGLGKGDVDLVSMCLISHELPADASRAIFQESYNILPVGGAISLMDMNPRSQFFQKFASNPFAFAAFKSTEPWIQEYVSMDLESTLEECGFSGVTVLENSPRHRTVVAYKK